MRQPLLENNEYEQYPDEKFYQNYDGDDDSDYEQEPPGCCDLGDEESFVNELRSYARSRQGAKLLVIMLLVGFATFSLVQWVLYPELADERMRSGFVIPTQEGESKLNTAGLAKGGEFQHGAEKIQDLDERLVPGGRYDAEGKRRLIFVGDIHGCKEELLDLLDKVSFDPAMDHLIATGDTINKGPDSGGVLDYLMSVNATSVRGNHEDRLIHTAKTVYDTYTSSPEASLPSLEDTDSLVNVTSMAHRDARTLKKLHRRHLRYIQHMPLILRIHPLPQASKPNSSPTSPMAEPILVVHAGLIPAVPLERQDPYFVTNMRSMHAKSHVPSADRAGKRGKKVGRHNKPWRNIWGWYNEHLFRHKSTKGFRHFQSPAQGASVLVESQPDSTGFLGRLWGEAESNVREYMGRSKKGDRPQIVVYGHDAKGGLRIKRWSKGLDSGCVGGGKLSALVVGAKGEGEVFDVGCKGYW